MKTAKYYERKAMLELVGYIMDGNGTKDFLEQYKEWDWETMKAVDPPEFNEDGELNEKYTEFEYAKHAVESFTAKLDSLI